MRYCPRLPEEWTSAGKGKDTDHEDDDHDSCGDGADVRCCRLLCLREEVLLHELHAGAGLQLRLRPGDLHVRYGVLLQEVMLLALLSLLGDCCSSMHWACDCFPCACIKCCCVYGAVSLGAVFAVLCVVRVVVGKEGVEVVGGDEKTRAEIAALLAKAHYSVASVAVETWHLGTAIVDVTHQTVTSSAGVISRLTGKELKILRLFSSDPKAVISREAILGSVWGLRYWGTTRTVDQHIAQLRKKLGIDIVSVRGVGYRLAD